MIDQDTLVPLGVALACLLPAILGTLWLNRRLMSLDYSMKHLSEQVEALRRQVSSDRWTATDMRNWVALANAKNPTIQLPTPKA